MKELNRHTIEEWLMMYIDAELTQEECVRLEAFILNNPEFEDLFDEYQSLKIAPKVNGFAGKELLKKEHLDSSINSSHADELAVYEADKELSELEEEWLANYRLNQPTFDYSKLKVVTNNALVYPSKELLKKKQVVLFRSTVRWSTSAIAAALLGFFVYFSLDENPNQFTDNSKVSEVTKVETIAEVKVKTPITIEKELENELSIKSAGSTSREFIPVEPMPIASVNIETDLANELVTLTFEIPMQSKATPDIAGQVNETKAKPKVNRDILGGLTSKAFVLKFKNRKVVIPPIKKSKKTSDD